METLNSMLYLLSYNSEVTTHALGVLSSYRLLSNCFFFVKRHIKINQNHLHYEKDITPIRDKIAISCM